MIVLDRFEGNTVVLEKHGEFLHTDINKISSSAKEGDVLVFQDDKYIVDELLTLNRKKEIEKKFKNLWK